MWKTKRVEDKPHLQYVSRQTPLFRGLPEIPSDPNKITARRADPHHLPSLLPEFQRRHCDLFVVPLDREKHDWIATAEGKVWEYTQLVLLYQRAAKYMYVNDRIDVTMYAKAQRFQTVDDVKAWAREVVESKQDRG